MNPVPIPELPAWSNILAGIAAQPLEFCPDFPAIARRYEAWWAHACDDRPLFIASANSNPARPRTRRLELLGQPDEWLAAKQLDLSQTHSVGDALPHIRVDFGPVLLGGLLGGKIEFGSDTTWTHAFIDDDWSNAPDWRLRDDNQYWKQFQHLTRLVAAEARSRFLVCAPDFGGSADVLLNLRGPTGLCLDVLEHPDRVRAAIDAIYPAWRQAYTEFYRLTVGAGAGVLTWVQLWSNRPYMPPACDFNYLIGPDEFQRLCLPDIARQAATAGRAVFHLDGPGAARHIDALLELPELQAIQFTPGEGTPSAVAWLEMFRKIQRAGKSVLISCPANEVLVLLEELRPDGLALWTGGLPAAELDQLFTEFRGRT
ncbi:MAG: hypothetical protein PCFJNLEI_03502 [Verrucomicrobiae bacterium]|nr:hypothetical protein [Verrucomicrobiae bacterium]